MKNIKNNEVRCAVGDLLIVIAYIGELALKTGKIKLWKENITEELNEAKTFIAKLEELLRDSK